MDRKFALLLTGMSGSGKTTIGKALVDKLNNSSGGEIKTQLIDGDDTRHMLGDMFSHTKDGRSQIARVNRLLGHYLLLNDINVIYALVTPFEDIREEFRDFFGNRYIEVYVKCSLEVCERRDVKGLYKKFHAGTISNLNGKDDAYEEPRNPEIMVDTVEESIDESCQKVLKYLKEKGFI